MAAHWDWFNRVVGREYVLGEWDCFQLLLDGQAALGLGRAFEPEYREGANAGLTMLRNFRRGFVSFRQVQTPFPGVAVLFRDGDVPVHVGFWLGPGLMAHTNTQTATTQAEFGPLTDFNYAFSGFYVPR